MKINKIFLMAGLAAMSLMVASCSDDDDYKKGPEAGSQNVGFVNQTNPVLGLTDAQFTVELKRSNASGELTVPLEVIQCADVLTAPSSVTFASGSETALLTIGVSNAAEAFVDYPLTIRIPGEYTNPYIQQDMYPILGITVLKEDYKPFAKADLTSWFFEETWEIDIEYSEYLDMYRIQNMYVDGYNYFYKLGKKEDDGTIPMTMCNSDGSKLSKQACGYVHSTYGMVSTTWLSDNFTGYDPDDDAYYIPFQWTVSAGSFGSGYESFQIK